MPRTSNPRERIAVRSIILGACPCGVLLRHVRGGARQCGPVWAVCYTFGDPPASSSRSFVSVLPACPAHRHATREVGEVNSAAARARSDGARLVGALENDACRGACEHVLTERRVVGEGQGELPKRVG